jgi:hypothetical protein
MVAQPRLDEMMSDVAAVASRLAELARLAPDRPNETYDEARAGIPRDPVPGAT